MAQPLQSVLGTPTKSRSSGPKPEWRIVCGWNDETHMYLYRDEVTKPPPLLGNGPEGASKQPKITSAKAMLPRGADVKFSSADDKPGARERMARRRRERASAHGRDGSDEIPVDERLGTVPNHLQGTVRPVPRPANSQEMQWIDMPITMVPLPTDPAVKIGGFDNIMVTLVSPENGKPHNEPAKVLDCRLHPDGTYFLLVSWWFERRTLSKILAGFKRYLDRRWSLDAPFEFVRLPLRHYYKRCYYGKDAG
ncbi:hypothetical protein V490_01578 [Pseudogymnoascus sp. VKM F-3557]|nr:hypothetical protein V490_01578 [Pseudogymnoascus sp. VKM F-3557]